MRARPLASLGALLVLAACGSPRARSADVVVDVPPVASADVPSVEPREPSESTRPKTERLAWLVAKHCAQLEPMGEFVTVDLQEGDSVKRPLTLEPGRCYTVVARGRGIRKLGLAFVVTVPPIPQETVLAAAEPEGPVAVVGSAPNCFKNPMPIAMPAQLRIDAAEGGGKADVQICRD